VTTPSAKKRDWHSILSKISNYSQSSPLVAGIAFELICSSETITGSTSDKSTHFDENISVISPFKI